MIKQLLVSCCLATALAGTAASPTATLAPARVSTTPVTSPLKAMAQAKKLSADSRVRVIGNDRLAVKRVLNAGIGSSIINPARRHAKPMAEESGMPAGAILFESFENPGDDITWLPETWTMESKGDSELTVDEKWGTAPANPMLPPPTDGDWCAAINYSSLAQDEWLISPEVSLDGIYKLKFDAYIDPAFFFVLDNEHVDWEAYEWTNQETAFTFQVLVQEKGGEFAVVRDFAEEYMGQSLEDLLLLTPSELLPCTVDLSAYNGKDVRIAFRYVGTDGQTMFLDNVRVTLPEMELSFAAPYSTLYYGIGNDEDWSNLNLRIALYPAFRPITFQNTTYDDALAYTWMYSDPATTEMVPGDDPEFLEMTYGTDYTSEFTTNNNLYYPPMLTASGEGYADGEKAFDVDFIQAGGHASFKIQGEYVNFGLLPFEAHNSSLGICTAEPLDFGKRAVPMFGHSEDTHEFWMNYTFHGEEDEGDDVQLNAIFNYIYPTNSPLVVKGAWLSAMGIINDDAELTAEIFPLIDVYDEEGEWLGQVTADTPIATAKCAGTSILGRDPRQVNYLSIPFEFASPVVIDESNPGYIIKISGFNSDACPYFVPAQSWIPNADYLCLGWIEKIITFAGNAPRASVTPLANHENEYGEMYAAFAINLDGYYPWLESDEEGCDFGSHTTATIALDSYHDGSELTVEAPEWIEATAAGRYGETVLNLAAAPFEGENREGTVTVSKHGLSKSFKVSQMTSGIVSATGDGAAAVKAIYNAAGVRVNSENLTPGVYIITRADGTAAKHVVK